MGWWPFGKKKGEAPPPPAQPAQDFESWDEGKWENVGGAPPGAAVPGAYPFPGPVAPPPGAPPYPGPGIPPTGEIPVPAAGPFGPAEMGYPPPAPYPATPGPLPPMAGGAFPQAPYTGPAASNRTEPTIPVPVDLAPGGAPFPGPGPAVTPIPPASPARGVAVPSPASPVRGVPVAAQGSPGRGVPVAAPGSPGRGVQVPKKTIVLGTRPRPQAAGGPPAPAPGGPATPQPPAGSLKTEVIAAPIDLAPPELLSTGRNVGAPPVPGPMVPRPVTATPAPVAAPPVAVQAAARSRGPGADVSREAKTCLMAAPDPDELDALLGGGGAAPEQRGTMLIPPPGGDFPPKPAPSASQRMGKSALPMPPAPQAAPQPQAPPPVAPPPAEAPASAPPPARDIDTTSIEGQRKLARVLLAAGALTREGLESELKAAGKVEGVLGKALLKAGYASEEALVGPLTGGYRLPKINIKNTKIPLDTIRLIPEEVARRHQVLPIERIGNLMVIVTPNVQDPAAIDAVRMAIGGLRVALIQCGPEGFLEVVDGYYSRVTKTRPPTPAPAVDRRTPAGAFRLIAADEEECRRARPLVGAHRDPRAEWEWTYTREGPVKVVEALL